MAEKEIKYPCVMVNAQDGIYVALSHKTRLPGKFTNQHFAEMALQRYQAKMRAAQEKRRENKE
jgi:hypothetical protein